MALHRPVVSVYKFDDPKEKTGTVKMPCVMAMPLRPDIVNRVHRDMRKNSKIAYAVKPKVGYETAAESWGTGRAVSRLPRVPGGGTHRAGQGAFGNMARGGGMFAPTQVWRRWHRHIPLKLRRTAVVSSLAASTLPPLVMAHGHRIGQVPEFPLVVSDGIQEVQKTKEAMVVLKKLGCGQELTRVAASKKIRAGKGKMRNRKYVMRKGPLVIYLKNQGIRRSMRNIPGVETANVMRLNLLKLAPGGQFGRFLIWTEGAFKKLQEIYGTPKSGCPLKRGYRLPRAAMENADLARIINSDEVQNALRPKLEPPKQYLRRGNPLKDDKLMEKLCPGWLETKKLKRAAVKKGTPEYELVQAKKRARIEEKKAHNKVYKKGNDTFYKKMMRAYAVAKAKKEEKKEDAEEGEEAGEEED